MVQQPTDVQLPTCFRTSPPRPPPSALRPPPSATPTTCDSLALLGRWLVPELPFSEGFLLSGARAVLRAARAAAAEAGGGANGGSAAPAVPVLAIGGFTSLAGVEAALAEGFAGVQMARALIREPALVRRWQRERAAGSGGVAASACSHCNKCVLASLAPELPARCVERPPVGEVEELL